MTFTDKLREKFERVYFNGKDVLGYYACPAGKGCAISSTACMECPYNGENVLWRKLKEIRDMLADERSQERYRKFHESVTERGWVICKAPE